MTIPQPKFKRGDSVKYASTNWVVWDSLFTEGHWEYRLLRLDAFGNYRPQTIVGSERSITYETEK